MSILQLFNSKKLENAVIWSGVFSVAAIPIGIIANKVVLPRLNVYPNERGIVNEQILKILIGTSAVIGFLYGFNTTIRLHKLIK